MEFISSQPSLLLDAAVIVAFFVFAVLKGDKGLYKTLVPMLVTVTAVSGGIILSEMLKDRVAEAVFPMAWDWMRERVDFSAVRSFLPSDISAQLERLLPAPVINIAGSLGIQIQQLAGDAVREAVTADARAIAEETARSVLYPVTVTVVQGLLFFLFLVLLKVLLGIVTSAAGLAFDLPVIGWINRIGGAAVGIIECGALLLILVRLIQISGVAPLISLVEHSRILSIFLKQG